MYGGIERTRTSACLGYEDGVGDASDDSITLEETPPSDRIGFVGIVFTNNCTTIFNDAYTKLTIGNGLDGGKRISEYGNCRPACVKCDAVS